MARQKNTAGGKLGTSRFNSIINTRKNTRNRRLRNQIKDEKENDDVAVETTMKLGKGKGKGKLKAKPKARSKSKAKAKPKSKGKLKGKLNLNSKLKEKLKEKEKEKKKKKKKKIPIQRRQAQAKSLVMAERREARKERLELENNGTFSGDSLAERLKQRISVQGRRAPLHNIRANERLMAKMCRGRRRGGGDTRSRIDIITEKRNHDKVVVANIHYRWREGRGRGKIKESDVPLSNTDDNHYCGIKGCNNCINSNLLMHYFDEKNKEINRKKVKAAGYKGDRWYCEYHCAVDQVEYVFHWKKGYKI